MDDLEKNIMNETVRFIEVCQNCVLAGKFDFDSYRSLTRTKFDFLKRVLDEEGLGPDVGDDFVKRLGIVNINEGVISSMKGEIAGK